ncbi:MAG TPA: PfkB family carbohydrate kinase, partial [Gemmataceae bacterium]|nr:PfkB family carbohydrate kinase [Gemmataceae bacterium]
MGDLSSERNDRLDVLAMGCVAIDDFLYVPEYPAPETKIRVTRGERRCGGLAGGALQTAAKLGARSAYAATLGDDGLSGFVANHFQAAGISLAYLRRQPGVRPIHSTIIVDTTHHTRTVFFSLDGAQGAQEDWPPAHAIESSRVLFIDHYGIEGMIRAAKIARAAGIPIVADFERNEWPGFDQLLALVDHLIVSEAFAFKLTQDSSPERACTRLHAGRQATTVVVTCGSQGCWYCADGSATATHQPAFPVDVQDSTGCGDVFHGAYAVGLARGTPLPERIRFASAAAALKAATTNFPTSDDV